MDMHGHVDWWTAFNGEQHVSTRSYSILFVIIPAFLSNTIPSPEAVCSGFYNSLQYNSLLNCQNSVKSSLLFFNQNSFISKSFQSHYRQILALFSIMAAIPSYSPS